MKITNKAMRRAAILIAIIVSIAMSAQHARAAAPPKINVILISWDGVQRDHLNELLAAGRLPNLAALRDGGRFIPLEVTTHKTDTKAGHAQMLTGYLPETTGVYDNRRYDAIPAGLSLFERIEAAFGDDAVTTILLTGKSANIGSMTAAERASEKQNKKNSKNKGNKNNNNKNKKKKNKKMAENSNAAEPWHLIKPSIDVWDGDISRAADAVGPLARGYLDQFAAQPFFFFLHFGDPDHAGHKYGENSGEYEKEIITCDTWLGALRKELDTLGIADRTLIYVTTDHGFDEGMKRHLNAPHIWLATNDKTLAAASGEQMDIAPTILNSYGLDPASFTPALPGKPLNK